MRLSVAAALTTFCFAAVVGVGCGSSDAISATPGVHDLATSGEAGKPASASFTGEVMVAAVEINGAKSRLLVDTGSPINLLSLQDFAIPKGSSRVGAITVGALTLLDVPVLGVPSFADASGILGGGTLCQFVTTLNYRDQQVTLGDVAAPASVDAPGVAIAFAREGGGTGVLASGEVVTFGATRISVTANIEGVDHPFIVDTGASFLVVRKSLHDRLVKDGRREQPIDDNLVAGSPTATATRVRSVKLGGAEVRGAPAAYPGSDEILDALGVEVQHRVDGLIGGTFLREFNVVIDYPTGTLRLQRYATRAHILDDFQRVGFALEDHGVTSVPRYFVSRVFEGTDAARLFVSRGDALLSVDDQGTDALDALDPRGADRLLRGTVGATHSVGLRRGGGSDVLFKLRVDELLPLP